MLKNGKMKESGLIRIKEAKESGEWYKITKNNEEFSIPLLIKKALVKNTKALTNFNNLAKSYKKQYVGWIMNGKRKETRKKRLIEAINLLEKNEKLGMK